MSRYFGLTLGGPQIPLSDPPCFSTLGYQQVQWPGLRSSQKSFYMCQTNLLWVAPLQPVPTLLAPTDGCPPACLVLAPHE